MGFRRSGLQEAFFVPGDQAFRVWGYGTGDALEEVLRPGYFAAAGLLAPGELIYLRLQAPPPRHPPGAAPAPVQMALLMVLGPGERGAVAVRLVQDLGRSDAAAAEPAAPPPLRLPLARAAAAPPRRGRGRPAGPRSRPAPAANGHDAGPAAR